MCRGNGPNPSRASRATALANSSLSSNQPAAVRCFFLSITRTSTHSPPPNFTSANNTATALRISARSYLIRFSLIDLSVRPALGVTVSVVTLDPQQATAASLHPFFHAHRDRGRHRSGLTDRKSTRL